MYLMPCRKCRHRGQCVDEVSQRFALRGLGFTAARFRCAILAKDLSPGTVCAVTVVTLGDDGEDDTHAWSLGPQTEQLEGVVMGAAKGGRVQVWVGGRDDRDDRQVIRVWPERCVPTGKRVEMCVTCRRPMTAEVDLSCEDGAHGVEPRRESW